jgi:hypothetical protein
MLLYHVTPAWTVHSIAREGLKTSQSSGRRPGVWLCDGARLPWIIGHVARCKGRQPASMRILRVACDLAAVTRERPGIYLSSQDIPPHRVVPSMLHTRIPWEPAAGLMKESS